MPSFYAEILGPVLTKIKQDTKKIGDLNELNTSAKNDLVAAINSVLASGGSGGGSGTQGPQGFQGSAGPQGSAGTQGGQGPQGSQGAQGPQGASVVGTGGSSVSFGTSPPNSPDEGERWVNSTTGIEYVWFNDGNSTQWVNFG